MAQPPQNPSNAVEGRLKYQDLRFRAEKRIDSATGAEATVVTDLQGNALDMDVLLATERELARTPANKIARPLRQRLEDSPSGAHDIVLWLNYDSTRLEFREEAAAELRAGLDRDEVQARMLQRVEQANREVTGPAAALVSSLGLPVHYVSPLAPVIFTTATASAIALLAEHPAIATIYLENKEGHRDLDQQVRTHRWDRVHNLGIRGDGMAVAIIEDDGVSNTHPAINHGGFFNPGTPNIQEHATTCAGIAGSSDGSYPGHARGVQILSGNSLSYSDTALTMATDWALGAGADVVNMSFTVSNTLSMVYLDRYVDYQIRVSARTFVKSCGNQAGGCGSGFGPVTSPGLAWNIIATGNVVDQGNADWVDDAMAFSSSWDDPISTFGDREKPELAAVGTDIISANTGGGFSNQGSGTSYSAPAIAGMCAALMQANNTLQSWPELMKAVMMAAATHNIEGSSRLSECDGAGAINGLQAYRIVEGGKLRNGSFTSASFSNNGYFTHDVWLQGGDLARVVLCWDSNANGSYTTDVLDADLDLAILAGQGTTSGAVLAASSSYDNSYEIVEFCPPSTGWYTIRVNDYRFDGSSEYYGLAWTQHIDGRYARFRPWLPDNDTSDLIGPSRGNAFFWLDQVDRVNPGRTFVLAASLGVGTPGFAFSDCRLSYGDLDPVAILSLDPSNPFFIDFVNTYNGSGEYYNSHINIPDVPGLEGLELYLTNLTIDPAAPGSLKEIGAYEKVTIWNRATDLSTALGDDGSQNVALPFSFSFFGTPYTDVWINANGNLSFGAAHGDFSESVSELEGGAPKICALWDDLNVNLGGAIRYRVSPRQLVVEWVNVPEFGTTSANQNSVILILDADGTIRFLYEGCSLSDCIVGVSAGGGGTGTAVDLSDGFRATFGTVYEEFTGSNPLDLDILSSYRHQVRFTPTGSTSYRVTVDGAGF